MTRVRLSKTIASIGSVILISLSFNQMANAAVSASVISTASAAAAPNANGGLYNNNIWFKTGNKIKKLTRSGTLTTEFTIPATINGVSLGSIADRVEIDQTTGIMYFSSGSGPMKIWSINLNDFTPSATLIFQGFTTSTCNSFVGGIAVAGNYLYFSCPDAYTIANVKIYRFTIPASGGTAKTNSDLTVIANSPIAYGFSDIEYRSQDGAIFALMESGERTTNSYIVRLSTSGSLPATLTTVKNSTANGGFGGITGIELDSQGNLFYMTYQASTSISAGFQVTDETPTVVATGTYTLPNSTTDAIYSFEWILDQGSLSTSATDIGYVTNGWGGIVKVSGAAVSSFSTVSELVITISTTSISIPDGPYIFRQSYNFTAVTNATGKISFWVNGKAISGCKSLLVNVGNSYSVTCVYKPSIHGSLSAYATFSPSGNATPSVSVTKYFSVIARAGNR